MVTVSKCNKENIFLKEQLDRLKQDTEKMKQCCSSAGIWYLSLGDETNSMSVSYWDHHRKKRIKSALVWNTDLHQTAYIKKFRFYYADESCAI